MVDRRSLVSFGTVFPFTVSRKGLLTVSSKSTVSGMSDTGDGQVSGQFEWAEPPPSKRGRQRDPHLRAFVQQLKTQPGRWAIFDEKATSWYPTSLKRTYPQVEWTTRTVRDPATALPSYRLYGRWVGES